MTLDTLLTLLFTGLSILFAHRTGWLPKILGLILPLLTPSRPSPAPSPPAPGPSPSPPGPLPDLTALLELLRKFLEDLARSRAKLEEAHDLVTSHAKLIQEKKGP